MLLETLPEAPFYRFIFDYDLIVAFLNAEAADFEEGLCLMAPPDLDDMLTVRLDFDSALLQGDITIGRLVGVATVNVEPGGLCER